MTTTPPLHVLIALFVLLPSTAVGPSPPTRLRGFVIIYFHIPKSAGTFVSDTFARSRHIRWASVRTREHSLELFETLGTLDPGADGYGPATLEARASRPRAVAERARRGTRTVTRSVAAPEWSPQGKRPRVWRSSRRSATPHHRRCDRWRNRALRAIPQRAPRRDTRRALIGRSRARLHRDQER